jgi:hypothetical protein
MQDTVHPVENGPQSDVVDDLRPLIAPLYAASARIIERRQMTNGDTRDLLSLMPRRRLGVEARLGAGSVRRSRGLYARMQHAAQLSQPLATLKIFDPAGRGLGAILEP